MVVSISSTKTANIEINKIITGTHQPRKVYDTKSLAELAASIRIYGVIQPITVRKTLAGYELVAGERRVRAARMAGLKKIPAIIQRVRDDKAAAVAIEENIQRENLNFIEEAESYMVLMSRLGLTRAELAARLGKPVESVSNKLDTLSLSESIKRRMVKNSLSLEHALALLKITDDRSRNAVLDVIIQQSFSVKQTNEYVAQLIEYLNEQNNPPVRKQVVKDVKIFANTINNAVEMIKKSGVDAFSEKSENDEFIEYVIKIAK